MSFPLEKTIYFARHGETEWNAIRRMQGQWNSDLSSLGRKQAHATGRLLAVKGVDVLFASPLDRARQTVEIVAEYADVSVHFDERIKERDCGDWSGEMYDDLPKRWPTEWDALQRDPFHYRGPGCENYPDMRARAEPFLAEIAAHPARTVAVVSHGLIGRVMLSILLGLDEERTLAIRQPNDVVYRVLPSPSEPRVEHFVDGEGPFEGFVTELAGRS